MYTSHRLRQSHGKVQAIWLMLDMTFSNHPAKHCIDEDDDTDLHTNEDFNFTMFGLNIDSMIVPFSLREWVKEWVDGKGLVEDAVGAG